MTASTGARERMQRRQELFSAELKLRRVMLHVMSAIAWACRNRHTEERQAQVDAYDVVHHAYKNVIKEQEELAR